MSAEAEDRAAEAEAAVDARAAEHDAALFLDVADQPLVELIRVATVGQITESHDGEVGRRPCIPAVELREASVEIASERQLLRLGGAEGGDSGDLQRQPQAQRAEVARQL